MTWIHPWYFGLAWFGLRLVLGLGLNVSIKLLKGEVFEKKLGWNFDQENEGYLDSRLSETPVFHHGWHIFVGARESSLYSWYEQIRIARPGPQNYGIEPGGAVHWWAVSLLVYVSNRDWTTTKGDITRTNGGFMCLLVFFKVWSFPSKNLLRTRRCRKMVSI